MSHGGAVRTDEEVSPDARRIDIWFTPYEKQGPSVLDSLGLLGRMGKKACTLEPFHQTPSGLEVMDCICKQHLFRGILTRRSPDTPLPMQWIISSGRPTGALRGMLFKRSAEWGTGIYDGPPLTHTRIVVVSELPVTRDTLLVRLMGAGRVFQQAKAELRALPTDALERNLALPILLRLRLDMPAKPQRTKDDEEFDMSTQDIVEVFIQQQRREGRDEARREAVLDLYSVRFGAPPQDVVAAIEQTADETVLRDWHKLLATASEAEVLSVIRKQSGH